MIQIEIVFISDIINYVSLYNGMGNCQCFVTDNAIYFTKENKKAVLKYQLMPLC